MEKNKTNNQPLQIAIQGYEGCFHQAAARSYFGKETTIIPCGSFREVVRQVSREEACNGGIMAIENSIAGSILANYHLLQKSDLRITGEIYLNIRQHLLVNEGVQLADIKEVHSHPMALQQCMGFFNKYPHWKLVETEDTALSAKQVATRRMKHTAAVAGKLSADLFNLQILAPNIHTEKKNLTRFLIVNRKQHAPIEAPPNKASICFHTDHTRGSLARVLVNIAEAGVNLSKLQSFPISGSEWKYLFHADLEFDKIEEYEEVIKRITTLTNSLQVLGLYNQGITI
jgi:prephenate dehydratase